MRLLRITASVAIAAIAGGPLTGWNRASAASERFVADCQALTRNAHRLAGTPEGREATDYIERRLREMGLDRVVVEEFATAQTAVKRCEIEIPGPAAGEKPTLQCLPARPNGIIPSVTPPEGITGEILHAGAGRPEDFKEPPLGRIVVLDYNCDRGWLRAFRLGAKAVVFVPPAPPRRHRAWQSLHVDANVNLPRFYYPGEREDLPEGAVATIHSEVVWESVTGRNLFALLRGTDPVVGTEQKVEEMLVVAAHVDSFGEIPRLSPGARGAANCAGLLKAIEYLKEHRPRRHLLFAFFDAQARGHAGSCAFYRVLEDDEDDSVHVDKRSECLEKERLFLVETNKILDEEKPWETKSDIAKRFIRQLKDKAEEHVDAVKELSLPLGREHKALSNEDSAEAARVAARIEELKTDENGWKSLRRGLHKGEIPAEVMDRAETVLREVLRDVEAHFRELEVEQRALLSDKEVKELVGDAWIALLTARLEVRLKELKTDENGWNSLRRGLHRGEIPAEVMDRAETVLREVRRDVEERSQELGVEQRALLCDREVKELVGDAWISLHCSFVFGDTSSRWGLIIGGDSRLHSVNDDAGYYSGIQRSFLSAFDSTERAEERLANFVKDTADGSFSAPRVASAAPYLVHSGEVAGRLGIYNLVLGTIQESLAREGTPEDALGKEGPVGSTMLSGRRGVDLDLIETQASEAAILLAETASQDGLSLRRAIVEDKQHLYPEFRDDNRVHGPTVMGKSAGSSLPNRPMGGVVVRMNMFRELPRGYRSLKPYAFEDFLICRTNLNGSYFFGPVAGGWGIGEARGFAAGFDERGEVVYASDLGSAGTVRDRLNVFNCRRGVLVLPPQLRIEPADVLGAKSDFRLENEKSYFATEDGVVYWYCERKVKSIKVFGKTSVVALVSGPPALDELTEKPTGQGFSLEGPWAIPNIVEQSAADIWRLNESRMKVLRERGVIDSSVQELHGRAEDMRIEAKDAGSVAEADALAVSAFMLEASVYDKTRQALDDLVRAVLVLLALSVPFAYALERLLVGSTSIYRQIMWFGVLFLATFLVLFFSHPAFAISKAPMIIFLGFTVLVLSSLVIVIIMRKFEQEIKVLQGLTSTVHTADVSRFSTIMAAMTMGISTMRRRPLRTALTAVTIVLLTFTILCFASFGRQIGIVKFFLHPPPGYAGAQIHRVNWGELDPDVVNLLRGRWAEGPGGADVVICSRYWVSPDDNRKYGVLIAREDGSKPTALRGVLGLETRELRVREDLAGLLGRDGSGPVGSTNLSGQRGEPSAGNRIGDTVWLTKAVAKRLEIETGDRVLVGGVRLTVGGLLEPSDVAGIQDMDGSYFLPVDFQEVKSVQTPETLDESALQSRQDWAALPTDSVVIVSTEVAKRMGATLRVITLYTEDVRAATAIGEEIARILPVPVVATRSDGVYRHILGSVIEAGGAKDLLFPILLGGLVIFGTMLGSVADREKEIYSFSALGLAPQHVAGLFFAEAMVYSVVGGLGGYLLAQAMMKVLGYLVDFGLIRRIPEMNYSSTNAIVTLLLVMATVLISAIYPAMRASRSANPGILRSWKLPAPEGDVFDIAFPFTVSQYDITGVVSFLKEHFDNFTDTSLGVFMSNDASIVRGEGNAIGLDSGLALAPFDLGVTQDFELRSAPSEIKGIDEVKIRIVRRSGQPKDWQRLNKVLLNDLRRQFLIWRALPPETMETYRNRTLTTLAGEAAPSGGPEDEVRSE